MVISFCSKNEVKLYLKEVKELCEQNLAEYTLPFDYEIKDKLPVTPIGKINTIELKREYEEKNKPKQLKK